MESIFDPEEGIHPQKQSSGIFNKASMSSSLEQPIREAAWKLGFGACQFTHAGQPDRFSAYQKWIQDGMHGEMSYLDRHQEKKGDLQKVLPGMKSIISLATSYLPPESSAPHPETFTGKVARYARFEDYHHVLEAPLKALCKELETLGGKGHTHLHYVDTGPIMERDLAQRAGLGFTGKHTNLISRKLGNWFFISEILTTLKLIPDKPEPNRCGHCARCLEACPTEAITEPFKLDARRCISYWTIEYKGSIPMEMRPLIGDRVFGCDDCLEVCPWNRFAKESERMKPVYLERLHQPDLLEWLELDDEGFKQKFRGTPMIRTKRRGLLRNVCVALGNTANAQALPALEKARQDPNDLIAEHARWAIDQIKKRLNSR